MLCIRVWICLVFHHVDGFYSLGSYGKQLWGSFVNEVINGMVLGDC